MITVIRNTKKTKKKKQKLKTYFEIGPKGPQRTKKSNILLLLPLPSSPPAKGDANFDPGAWSSLPMNTFILVVYLMLILLNSFLRVSCLATILMIPQCSYFDVVFILFLSFTAVHPDCDDYLFHRSWRLSWHTHDLPRVLCLSFVSRHWFSQLVCWNTVHMGSGLEGISCLWKSF